MSGHRILAYLQM